MQLLFDAFAAITRFPSTHACMYVCNFMLVIFVTCIQVFYRKRQFCEIFQFLHKDFKNNLAY